VKLFGKFFKKNNIDAIISVHSLIFSFSIPCNIGNLYNIRNTFSTFEFVLIIMI
jgi:hypothetical protein